MPTAMLIHAMILAAVTMPEPFTQPLEATIVLRPYWRRSGRRSPARTDTRPDEKRSPARARRWHRRTSVAEAAVVAGTRMQEAEVVGSRPPDYRLPSFRGSDGQPPSAARSRRQQRHSGLRCRCHRDGHQQIAALGNQRAQAAALSPPTTRANGPSDNFASSPRSW